MPIKANKAFYLITAASTLTVALVGYVIFFAPTHQYDREKVIQYRFKLKNTTNRLIKNPEFWLYAPVKKTANQLNTQLDASSPYTLINDPMGNQIMHFKLNAFPPNVSRTLTIKAVMKMAPTANRVTLKKPNQFIKKAPYIESDHPEIKHLAQQLHHFRDSATIRHIYQWMTEHIQYQGYIKEDRGALYALKHKTGDCTENMYLTTALARANEIPSRGMGGYVIKENGNLDPNNYHNWSEIYFDHAWRIIDPQNKQLDPKNPDYIAMRIISHAAEQPMKNTHQFMHNSNGIVVQLF